MRWTPGQQSPDIEDERGRGGGGFVFGGLGGFNGPILRGPGFGGSRLGLGALLLIVLVSLVFHRNLFDTTGPAAPTQTISPYGAANRSPETGSDDASESREVQFVSFVLDDVQKTWGRLLPAAGTSYRHAKLVLFRDYTVSACGAAEAATGPFYCPADEKVYVDLGLFDELAGRLGAPGEFAQAYVIAHRNWTPRAEVTWN